MSLHCLCWYGPPSLGYNQKWLLARSTRWWICFYFIRIVTCLHEGSLMGRVNIARPGCDCTQLSVPAAGGVKIRDRFHEPLTMSRLPLDKEIQNTQEIKRTLFNWTEQDNTCKLSRKSSFSSYVQHKNRKKKNPINSTYLESVRCSEAGGRKRAQD